MAKSYRVMLVERDNGKYQVTQSEDRHVLRTEMCDTYEEAWAVSQAMTINGESVEDFRNTANFPPPPPEDQRGATWALVYLGV